MDHWINLRLVFNCKPLSFACSGLKSCYDQIFHSAVIISLQRLGILLPEIISMLDTIQCILHTVRTAYSYSNVTYGGDTIPYKFRHFIVGLFQQNGNAPQIWSIISSVVFSALQAQGFGIHFENSFMEEISQLVGFSYVD